MSSNIQGSKAAFGSGFNQQPINQRAQYGNGQSGLPQFQAQQASGGVNPFQQANPNGQPPDQLALFRSQLGNGLNPNLLSPPLPAEGNGQKFKAYA